MHAVAHTLKLSRKGVVAMFAGRWNTQTPSGRTAAARKCRLACLTLLLIAGALAWSATTAQAQIIISELDTLRVLNATTTPGDTFFVDFYIANSDTVGGYSIRVVFDPTAISPLTDTGTVISVEQATVLRGPTWPTLGGSLPIPGVMTFLASIFDNHIDAPLLKGSGPTLRLRWLARSTAPAQTTQIRFEQDPDFPQSANNLNSWSGLKVIQPVKINGTITITEDGGGGAPVIDACPGPFTGTVGSQIMFNMSATDLEGDNVTLTATGLPTGATFGGGSQVTGNTTASGNFIWFPTALQQGDYTVGFQAHDDASPTNNYSTVCTVAIHVGPSVGSPPDISCQSGSITVDQGQTVSFTVSASDPDNDTITVTELSPPSGSTFSLGTSHTGLGPLSGTFNWTPSFSQSGAFTVTFQVTDTDNNSDACNTTIFVNEVQKDQLFTTSAPGQAPKGGVPGTPNVVVPINFVMANSSYGVQFDFVYDATVFTPTQVQASTRLAGFQLYDDLGDNPGRIRVVAFDLGGAAIDPGETSVLFNIIGNMEPGTTPGAYPVMFENAWESVSPDPKEPSVALATTDGVIMVDNVGDPNLDTRIDVADVVAVVGYILGNYTFDLRQFVAGDIIVDGFLDVFDLQGIINVIYGLPVSPAPGIPTNDTPATVNFVYNPGDGALGSFYLITDAPVDVAGAQVQLLYDSKAVELGSPELMTASAGMDLAYRDHKQGALTALMIDPTATTSIASGRQEILRIPVLQSSNPQPIVRMKAIKLAGTDASKIEVKSNGDPVPRNFALYQNYPNPFNPSTTIAFSLGGASQSGSVDVRLDIYNVLGQRVTTLVNDRMEPGRYEFQWDGTDRSGQTVASGLYFYRLAAGGQQETKKMVMLK